MNKKVVRNSALLLAVILAVGCGPTGPKLYKATGIVTYKGSPVSGASITFLYDDGNFAVGGTGADGRFDLTMNGRAGTKSGKAMVSIAKVTQPAGAAMPAPSGKPSFDDMANMMKDRQKAGTPTQDSAPEKPKNELPVKYADAKTSGLTAEVLTNAPNEFTFDLKD